jgi:hypothetical protein
VNKTTCIRVQHLPPRVESDPAPVHATSGERKQQGALERWWGVQAFASRLRHEITTRPAIPRREPERLVRVDPLRHERGHVHRYRLRGRKDFASDAVLGYWAFLDGKHRLTGIAIEHEYEPHLRALNHHVALAVVEIQRRERRLRGHIVVPDIVVDRLVCPRNFAALGLQRDDRVRMRVCSGSQSTKKIRTRTRGGKEHKPAALVCRHRRPHIRMTHVLPGIAPRRSRRIGWVTRNGVPKPARLSRPHVERAHCASRSIDSRVVADRRADDDDARHDHRR